MGPINVVVQDANNLVLEVTPTPSNTIILDRGVVGPTGLVWKGNWSSATLYIPNDAVFNAADNASYICIAENTNQQPPNAIYWDLLVASSATGDVTGPASATDNAIARFDGTTGKLIQNSGVTISDAGVVNISSLTASKAVFTDASDNLTSTGTLGVDQGGTGATSLAGASIATYSGTETLINKTLTTPTITGAILNDGYTEEVFAVSGTTPALSPTNGSIQTWTLSGASTPTAGTWAAGQSLTLMIDDGTAYSITWTSLPVTWKTDGGSAPTLNTSGFTAIQLWKVGTTIYGARVGDA